MVKLEILEHVPKKVVIGHLQSLFWEKLMEIWEFVVIIKLELIIKFALIHFSFQT